jgi:hypothetical protein
VNSSLPIRTETAGDVIAKIADATTPSQQLTVNPDGSINITDNGGTITVDGTVTVTATNLDIRDLAFATDKVDVSGSSVTVSATNLDIRDLTFAADKVDVSGSSVTVSATNLDIRDLTSVTDSVAADLRVAGTAVSASNPVPVTLSAAVSGTEVNDHNQGTAIAGGATSNHDYTAVGNFLLTQIEASASGKARIAVQIETGVATGVFNSVFVQFNSTANPNMCVELKAPIAVAAGVRVRVARKNNENQAQDLYSTISGQET